MSCGDGTRTRTRVCLAANLQECVGDAVEMIDCDQGNCPIGTECGIILKQCWPGMSTNRLFY